MADRKEAPVPAGAPGGSTDSAADDALAPYRDEMGTVGPLPADDGQRRMPEEGFFTGPEVGQRLPDIRLVAADGRTIDVHKERAGAKAAVVFFRSAVW